MSAKSDRLQVLLWLLFSVLVGALFRSTPGAAQDQSDSSASTGALSKESVVPRGDERLEAAPKTIPLHFAGRLPGSVSMDINGEFQMEFRIYRSPQGGEPIWKERRTVEVKSGRMDVLLGEVEPIPLSVHEETFKFLGVSVNGQREAYPRAAVVNVVYASPKEALVEIASRRASAEGAAETRKSREVKVERGAPRATTWLEALEAARAAGADLPDHEEWYRALERGEPDQIAEMVGHYEWVLPWVYDTASHGRFNEYFRGRFQGCDYMDLSPKNKYVYRVVRPVRAAPPESEASRPERDANVTPRGDEIPARQPAEKRSP